ncbi:hypothetical protein H4R34_001784 [Dimargaris verticillata]|uniref:RING-type E3 ubiquitin transferase n=1 Tax=Dimargaris verticillata TaxID=2761393 RepID=A0A9W8B9B1_9FUNG|nr:hypothetical protein H4R34_001784 [Dimargaris verticillata]
MRFGLLGLGLLWLQRCAVASGEILTMAIDIITLTDDLNEIAQNISTFTQPSVNDTSIYLVSEDATNLEGILYKYSGQMDQKLPAGLPYIALYNADKLGVTRRSLYSYNTAKSQAILIYTTGREPSVYDIGSDIRSGVFTIPYTLGETLENLVENIRGNATDADSIESTGTAVPYLRLQLWESDGQPYKPKEASPLAAILAGTIAGSVGLAVLVGLLFSLHRFYRRRQRDQIRTSQRDMGIATYWTLLDSSTTQPMSADLVPCLKLAKADEQGVPQVVRIKRKPKPADDEPLANADDDGVTFWHIKPLPFLRLGPNGSRLDMSDKPLPTIATESGEPESPPGPRRESAPLLPAHHHSAANARLSTRSSPGNLNPLRWSWGKFGIKTKKAATSTIPPHADDITIVDIPSGNAEKQASANSASGDSLDADDTQSSDGNDTGDDESEIQALDNQGNAMATSLPETHCQLCRLHYVPDEMARLLPCRHSYHQRCIDHWLTTRAGVCPVCHYDCVPYCESKVGRAKQRQKMKMGPLPYVP